MASHFARHPLLLPIRPPICGPIQMAALFPKLKASIGASQVRNSAIYILIASTYLTNHLSHSLVPLTVCWWFCKCYEGV